MLYIQFLVPVFSECRRCCVRFAVRCWWRRFDLSLLNLFLLAGRGGVVRGGGVSKIELFFS